MDIRTLSIGTVIDVKPISQSISQNRTNTAFEPASESKITVTQAPAPVGYDASELYVRSSSVTAIEHNQHGETDVFNNSLEKKLSENYFGGYDPLKGMLGQVVKALHAGEQSISQTSSNTIYQTRIKAFNPAEQTKLETSRKKESELSFQLKTAEGDVVTFSLIHDYSRGKLDGHAGSYSSKNYQLAFSVDGDLNRQEIQSIESFTRNLDAQIDKVSRGKEIDFKQLNIFSDSVIAQVDVSLKQGTSGKESFNLSMKNTEDARAIEYQGGLQVISLSLDNSSLLGGKPGSQEAITELLKSLEDGISNAKDITGKGGALIDAARNLFVDLTTDDNLNAVKRLGYSVVSGLPDFKIEYQNSMPTNGSPLVLVKLSAEQATQIKQDNLKLDISQKYEYELDYQFKKPLPHLERVDLENGNYIGVSGHETQSRLSRISTDDQGKLTNAFVFKEAEYTLTETEYTDHKITRKDVKKQVLEEHQDLVSQILVAENNDKLLLIEGVTEHLVFQRG